MTRMARSVPYLGYIIVAGRRPAEPGSGRDLAGGSTTS